MTSLLILGAGGHGRVLAETAIAQGNFTNIAFLDDVFEQQPLQQKQLGWPLLGPLKLSFNSALLQSYPSAVVGIGHAGTRLNWLKHLATLGFELPSLIHPTAWVSPSSTLAAGSVVLSQASVQSHACIGSGAILNTGCSIDHDSHLSDGVHVCPGARLAGGVQVGSRSWIGIGASVIQNIHIGSDVTVGAGAAVVRDLPNGITAVGVPASPK